MTFASQQLVALRDPNLIESVVLGAAQTTIQFRDIPQHWLDLRLLVYARSDRAADRDSAFMRFGTGGVIDSGNNYDVFFQDWTDSTDNQTLSQGVAQVRLDRGAVAGATLPANTFCTLVCDIIAYRGAGHKVMQSFGGEVSADTTLGSNVQTGANGLWRNTGPIDSIDLFLEMADDYVAGSEFHLYGFGYQP